jgi:hypothetical protein
MMASMRCLRIDELLGSAMGDAAHVDRERVERYARRQDELPPVVVFETEDGLLPADGYHRVAAARRRGAETVEADVRQGSRQDALRYAAAVGAVQHGVSAGAALARIKARSQRRRRQQG